MTRIEREGEGFTIPASLLTEAFGLTEAEVRDAMRAGVLTSRCEAGLDADAGTWRLTFLFRGWTLRLTVDDGGKVLKRVFFPVRSRMARPGLVAGRRSR